MSYVIYDQDIDFVDAVLFKNEASFLLSFLGNQFLVVLYDEDMIMY